MGADVLCACCSTLRALLHCAQHGARLCLPCDVRVHAAAQDHRRAPLCDGCHAAPAAARCAHHQALLCAPCARAVGCDADRHARRAARAYTGIPDPAELARILYCECDTAAPPPLSPAPAEWVPDLINVELLPDLPSSSSSSWRDGNITRPDTSDEAADRPRELVCFPFLFDA
ncbi:putative zinc finger protein At1g68190 isoform X2 [Panicum virgatum]|nr:putative zinc finger protein At1g68190 isoform X2 [Panicum virgatum]